MSNEEQKILIIEDDKDISSLLTEFLSQNGFAAHTAANGLEGLNRALSGQYSLILLDLMLPFQSGDEVLRKLRRESDIPVIVLSAKSLTRDNKRRPRPRCNRNRMGDRIQNKTFRKS